MAAVDVVGSGLERREREREMAGNVPMKCWEKAGLGNHVVFLPNPTR